MTNAIEYENEYEILEKKLNKGTKNMKMYNIYEQGGCHIAFVNEEELKELQEQGLIQPTDIIEEDAYGYTEE